MGKGDEQKAINICQTLIKNKEESIRQQAKQLLSILNAPNLPKPSNWSVEIPRIEQFICLCQDIYFTELTNLGG